MNEGEIEQLRHREVALEAQVAGLNVRLAAQAALAHTAQAFPPDLHSNIWQQHAVLSATVDKSPVAMVVSDPSRPDNPIIFANAAFQALSGYSAEELIGRNCRFMQGEGTSRKAIAELKAAIADRRDVTVDLLNYRKDGSSFLNELHISPVFGADGELRYFFGCQIDATESRETTARLAVADGLWRRRFEQLQEGFMVGELTHDSAGQVVGWCCLEANEAWENLTGHQRRGTPPRVDAHLPASIEADMASGWTDDFEAVVATGEPRTVIRRLSLSGRAAEARIFRPEPGHFGVLLRDVTDRVKREIRRDLLLKLSEILRDDVHHDELAYRAAALLGTSLEVSRVGYATIDLVSETISIVRDWTAPGTRSLAGRMHFRHHGSYIEDLRRGVTVAIADSRLDDRTVATTSILETMDARSFVNTPVAEDEGVVALLYVNHAKPRQWLAEELELIREVAERTQVMVARRRAELALGDFMASLEEQVEARTRDLIASEEQLRQSQKMEAVGQLTGGLAHDFNNLLTGITGSLELMGTRIAQGRYADVDRYVAAAQGAARRAAALTHRLLAFSRRQTLDPKPININSLVTGIEELIRRTVGPSVDVEVVGATGLWTARVDGNQLENALLNLCINARDAMPDGGRITIETANTWIDGRGGKECDLPPGQYIALSVSDSGTGMDAQTAARAFEPFYTTKPLGQGTGLGLSMIYGFVRQSEGQVRIYSELGHGTTMRLYLPRHHAEAADADSSWQPDPVSPAACGETVLIVDDEPTIRMLVTEILGDLGYTALEAADGPSALKVVNSAARIDLLVTDVGLPGGMNGRQVADAARALRPHLKVLFITGYAENAVIGNGHLAPGMHVLTKPFAMEMLGNRVRELLGEAGA